MVEYLASVSKGRLLVGSFILCCGFLLLFNKDYNSTTLNYSSVYIDSDEEDKYDSRNANLSTLATSTYLVNSSKCKIPNVSPFNEEANRFYHLLNYYPCTKQKLLSYVVKKDNIATLHIDSEIAPSFTKSPISCCYSNVSRHGSAENPDDGIQISNCVEFQSNTTLAHDFISVHCKDTKGKKIYENVHSAITINDKVALKLENIKKKTPDPLSVLFVGIDSISRLNLIRHLPNTHKFLQDNHWISLLGYNKIGENTFPNLMGILTGFNESRSYSTCNPRIIGNLDRCPIIWYDYRKNDYVTAFNEDETWINTFNYGGKKGFTQQPTDYYFRPYMMASEKLKRVTRGGMNYCTGPETAGERVLNTAKDFAETFRNEATFGFFWMNTFSHNELNAPSMMDKKVHGFLQELSKYTDNSIVIFLSDHGIRFGEIRYTATGWLEERLPFIYISLPKTFPSRFPQEYKNLKGNVRKLTTPYDLHMTLQHILTLSGLNHTSRPSEACPKCMSLFSALPKDRSCEEAGIEPHWCTCGGYSSISPNLAHVQNAAKFIVGQIHSILKEKSKCAKYTLRKIITASISNGFTYKDDTYLLLMIETKPKAIFEATVLYEKDAKNNQNFSIQGGISRLDVYSSHSRCVQDAYLKKYCYCRY